MCARVWVCVPDQTWAVPVNPDLVDDPPGHTTQSCSYHQIWLSRSPAGHSNNVLGNDSKQTSSIVVVAVKQPQAPATNKQHSREYIGNGI